MELGHPGVGGGIPDAAGRLRSGGPASVIEGEVVSTHVAALHGETNWQKGMATFCEPFTTAKVRYFKSSEAAEAHNWLTES
jgi:hypothetical protein